MRTLHLRCGDDLRDRLSAAGWDGDYQSFVDPLWQGPAWVDGDHLGLLMRRARFVAAEYGADCADAYQRLSMEYAALENAHLYDRIVLWCEHDVYDQIALIRILHAFAHPDFHGRIFTIPADGVRHFGAMETAELAALHGTEEAVDAARIAAGSACWQAFSAFENPQALRDACQQTWPWPHLDAALARLQEEFPSPADGLARSERGVLQALTDGPRTLPDMMRVLHTIDPVFSISDLALLAVLRRMENTLLHRDGATWRLTQVGETTVAGTTRVSPTPRWIGGCSTRFS